MVKENPYEAMWIKEYCKDEPDEDYLDFLNKMRKTDSFDLKLLITAQYEIKRAKTRKAFQQLTYEELVTVSERGKS